jgi:hypothetical protein
MQGMIDIFHPERLSINLEKKIRNCLHERLIQRLLLVSSLNRNEGESAAIYT